MRRFLLLLCLCAACLSGINQASAQEQETTDHASVSGMLLTKEGAPLNGGLVYFFSAAGPIPDPDHYWRVPEFLAEVHEKGDFSIELPAGKYYFGAIKRSFGKTENGPPQVGDYFYKSLDAKGHPKLYVLKEGQQLDIGTITNVMPLKEQAVAANDTAIEGIVMESDGTPVAGALVFAFLSESMSGKPNFASYKTGADGKYLLKVNTGGKYYLRVRDIYGGGPPAAGAIIGKFGGLVPQAVVVKTGKITKGIDIVAERFKGRGQYPDEREEKKEGFR